MQAFPPTSTLRKRVCPIQARSASKCVRKLTRLRSVLVCLFGPLASPIVHHPEHDDRSHGPRHRTEDRNGRVALVGVALVANGKQRVSQSRAEIPRGIDRVSGRPSR